MITFNNKPNELHETVSGQKIWHSRSVAVASTIIIGKSLYAGENGYVLVVQRGENVDLEPNKYCLPCGYLDWEEEGYQAAIREVYEESGLYVPDLQGCKVFDNFYSNSLPWFVNTRMNDQLQNVTLHYGMYILQNGGELPPLDVKVSKDEIKQAFWLPLEQCGTIDFAFNHNKHINNFFNTANKHSRIFMPIQGKDEI